MSMDLSSKKWRYFKAHRDNLYLALEDINDMEFFWTDKEVKDFDELWKLKTPLNDIAIRLNKTFFSVFLMAIDRGLKGQIEPRDGWRIW